MVLPVPKSKPFASQPNEHKNLQPVSKALGVGQAASPRDLGLSYEETSMVRDVCVQSSPRGP